MTKCSLCGSEGVNKTSCPLNPKSINPKPHLHNVEPTIDELVEQVSNLKLKELPKEAKGPGKVVFHVGDKGVLLAKEFTKKDGSDAVDPVGWWASEKFDGYRAIWDGNKFVSRAGKVFNAPQFFKDRFPKGVALDGELWLGRCKFQDCGIFRKKVPIDSEWVGVKYLAFDVPNLDRPFEARMAFLHDIIKDLCRNDDNCPIIFTEQIKIESRAQLQGIFKEVVKGGGEGMMLRQPGSLYERKRSSTLLKMKPTFDTECRIIGYKPGTGKYKGMLGSFECSLLSDDSKVFFVSGMDDDIRKIYKRSHPIGTVITITYNDTSNEGIPRHPRYLRIRED